MFYDLWPARLAHALNAEGVRTWNDLAACSRATLLAHKGVSGKTLAWLEARLAERDLAFSGSGWQVASLAPAPIAPYSVYFAQCEGFIKIGHAKNVKRRLKDIETLLPFTLTVLHAVPCASKAEAVQYEAELHAQFALLRHRGEWFAHEGRLRDYLAQECRS